MEPEEREKLKKIDQLISAIDKTYHHPGNLAARGFLMGMASGLGATLGVAIVVSLIGLLIRWLGGLPVVGDWFLDISNYLPKN